MKKNYNVIEVDEEFIGTVNGIREMYEDECINAINRKDYLNLYLYAELLNNINNDMDGNRIDEMTVIKVNYHPMGAYQYMIMEGKMVK